MKQAIVILVCLVGAVWLLSEQSPETIINSSDSIQAVSDRPAIQQENSSSTQSDKQPDPGQQNQTNAKPPKLSDSKAPSTAPTANADTRPLPTIPSNRQKDVFTRVIGDHFRSHPSTEQRIWALRNLDEKNQSVDSSRNSPSANVEEPDFIERGIRLKNATAKLASTVFTKVVGPLSLEQEWQEGQAIHEQLLASFKVDQTASQRVAKIGNELLDCVTRTSGRAFTFTVVNDDQVNAFAHLGGHVYVYQGLLDLITEDHQLQFVLAHEIAHVELEHCSNAALAGVVAERNFGSLAKLPADLAQKIVTLSYSPKQELASDAWARRTLSGKGLSEPQIADFFYLLLAHEESLKSKSASTK